MADHTIRLPNIFRIPDPTSKDNQRIEVWIPPTEWPGVTPGAPVNDPPARPLSSETDNSDKKSD